MQERSLQFRLLLASGLSIAIALGIAGLALAAIFQNYIENRVERELTNDLRQLASLMETPDDQSVRIDGRLSDPRFDLPFSGRYWQMSNAGEIIDAAPSLLDQTLTLPSTADAVTDGLPHRYDIEGPNGSKLFAMARMLDFMIRDTHHRVRIISAIDRTEMDGEIVGFRWAILGSLGIIGLLLLLAAWVQVKVGLQPLRGLIARLQEVRSGAARRLGGEFPTEVGPLVEELNGLLDSQEKLLAKARARAGDLAHGLKTPLTVLTSIARSLRSQGNAAGSQDIDEQVGSMVRHVERELARSRLGASRNPDLVPLKGIVTGLVDTMRRLPRGDEIDWQVEIADQVRVPMDRDDLSEVLGNLLDNARKWTKDEIRLTFINGAQMPVLVVEDNGPGVPEDKQDLILERGQRLDSSRSGSGLGLAIVGDIADAYGYPFTLFRSPLGGLGARLGFERGATAIMPAKASASPAE